MTKKERSLVSIGLPVYNGADSVTRSIDSILAQTYKNFEFLISDNASNDETQKICEAYAAADSRIKYIRQKENLGFVKNVYFVLEKAKGEYFMWIADDDWWAPNYIESLVGALENNPEHGIAQCGFRRILPSGKVFGEERFEGENNITNDSNFTVYRKIFRNNSLLNHFIYGLFRGQFLHRAVFEKPLMIEQSWDKILVSEFALATKFYCVPEVLRFSEQRKNRPHDDKLRKWFFPWAYSAMLLRSFGRILTSRVVPLRMKFIAIIPWLLVIWHQRRRFIGFTVRDLGRMFRSKLLTKN